MGPWDGWNWGGFLKCIRKWAGPGVDLLFESRDEEDTVCVETVLGCRQSGLGVRAAS